MADYVEKLLEDLPEQFRGRPKIEALFKVIGKQLDELQEFYNDLNVYRAINTASGAQLDAIGNILVLDRKQAQDAMNKTDPLSDEEYRRMLIYKTELNFGDGTYRSIMNCIKIIRGSMMGFMLKEDPSIPATIILETEESAVRSEILEMLYTPVPRAGGVGLRVRANDGAEFGYASGITSQVFANDFNDAEDIHYDSEYTWYADEDGVTLCDEEFNILLHAGRETGVIPQVILPPIEDEEDAQEEGEGGLEDDTENNE